LERFCGINESDGTKYPQLSDFKVKWIADIHREKYKGNSAYYCQW